MQCICSFHVKLESIVTPKNLVEFFSIRGKPSIIELESIFGELFVFKMDEVCFTYIER